MDPIAHSLAGATIAQTGLRRLTPLATMTLVIAANLPDIDGVYNFLGSDKALLYRRGITHGVLAMVILPIVLTSIIFLYDRLIRLRKNPHTEPIQARFILLLSALGIWSHPLLDLLNTYGVRLLSPFDNRWFYGDLLFIVDAWMWLLMAFSVVVAYSKKRLSQIFWLVLSLATTTLITFTDFVPISTKILWFIGMAIIIIFREHRWVQSHNHYVASACIAVFLTYLALMFIGNQHVEQKIRSWHAEYQHKSSTGVQHIEQMMVGPVAGNAFYRDVLIRTSDEYLGLRVPVLDLFDFEKKDIQKLFTPVRIFEPKEIIERALSQKEIHGFTRWMRFPLFEVTKVPAGEKTIIRDLRYVLPTEEQNRGIGMAAFITPMPLP